MPSPVHPLVRDTAEGFADAVVRVLTDEALRGELADNGRSLVEQQFSWGVIAPDVSQTYTALADRTSGDEGASG